MNNKILFIAAVIIIIGVPLIQLFLYFPERKKRKKMEKTLICYELGAPVVPKKIETYVDAYGLYNDYRLLGGDWNDLIPLIAEQLITKAKNSQSLNDLESIFSGYRLEDASEWVGVIKPIHEIIVGRNKAEMFVETIAQNHYKREVLARSTMPNNADRFLEFIHLLEKKSLKDFEIQERFSLAFTSSYDGETLLFNDTELEKT